jgi:hypothetical protein
MLVVDTSSCYLQQYDYSYDYLDPEEVKPTEQEKPSTEQEKPSTGQEKPPTEQEKPPTEHQKPSTVTDTSPTSTTVLSDLSTTAGPEGSDQKQQQASVGRSRRCKPGYWRDSHGQCRRNRKPNDHTLQKLPWVLHMQLHIAYWLLLGCSSPEPKRPRQSGSNPDSAIH